MQQAVHILVVVGLEKWLVLKSLRRRLVVPFRVRLTKIYMLKYFENLEGGGALDASLKFQSGLSLELVRALSLRVVELKNEWSMGDTMYLDHERTSRDIMCVEELVSGLESWYGALNFVVP